MHALGYYKEAGGFVAAYALSHFFKKNDNTENITSFFWYLVL